MSPPQPFQGVGGNGGLRLLLAPRPQASRNPLTRLRHGCKNALERGRAAAGGRPRLGRPRAWSPRPRSRPSAGSQAAAWSVPRQWPGAHTWRGRPVAARTRRLALQRPGQAHVGRPRARASAADGVTFHEHAKPPPPRGRTPPLPVWRRKLRRARLRGAAIHGAAGLWSKLTQCLTSLK